MVPRCSTVGMCLLRSQVYETIDDNHLTYIKLFNLQSKVMCNRAYGRLTKSLLPFLTSIHIAPRPIWLCRSGLPVGDQKDEDHNPFAECKVSVDVLPTGQGRAPIRPHPHPPPRSRPQAQFFHWVYVVHCSLGAFAGSVVRLPGCSILVSLMMNGGRVLTPHVYPKCPKIDGEFKMKMLKKMDPLLLPGTSQLPVPRRGCRCRDLK